MEKIINFIPIIWKFFQLDGIQKDQKKFNELKNWKEKLQFSFKFIVFGTFVANLIAYLCIAVAEFFLASFLIEQVSILVVVVVIGARYTINYVILFINLGKIRKLCKQLPQNYSDNENEMLEINKKIILSRIPMMLGFISTPLTQIYIAATEGISTYTSRIIRTDYLPKLIGRNLFDFWIVLNTNFVVTLSLLIESFTYGTIIVLTTEFQMLVFNILELNQKFQNILRCSDAKVSEIVEVAPKVATPEALLIPELNKIIEKHSEILEIFNQLEEIFSPILLVNFIFGLIGLCFEEFTVIVASDASVFMPVFSSAVTQIYIFFIQCYYCQQLKDASLSISDAIYDCKWENIEGVKLKKHLLMILMRSQKSKTLTCWKFAENSFELFGSVNMKDFEYFL